VLQAIGAWLSAQVRNVGDVGTPTADRPTPASWLLAAVNIAGGLVVGYNAGVIAPALVSIKNENSELNSSTVQQGVLTAAMIVGSTIGSLLGTT